MRRNKPNIIDKLKFTLNQEELEKKAKIANQIFQRNKKSHKKYSLVIASNKRPKTKTELKIYKNIIKEEKIRKQERKNSFSKKLISKRMATGPITPSELKARKLVIGIYPKDKIKFLLNDGTTHSSNFVRLLKNPENKKMMIELKNKDNQKYYLYAENIKKRV
jgi:hypothetical protein